MRVLNSLALILCVMLMLLNINCCRAAVLADKISNTPFRFSGGRLEDYGLIGEDMEVEMLMESQISRMLIGANQIPKIDFTKVADKTIKPCGTPQYGPCLKDKKPPANCNGYNRECK